MIDDDHLKAWNLRWRWQYLEKQSFLSIDELFHKPYDDLTTLKTMDNNIFASEEILNFEVEKKPQKNNLTIYFQHILNEDQMIKK